MCVRCLYLLFPVAWYQQRFHSCIGGTVYNSTHLTIHTDFSPK